ncbi:GAF and ANTAR domain-containing protein [Mycolicibacterium bacteremicum]|uniref:Response regulator receiver protein n=1 Tax=Mycolicibacterium bacteremicum TaxID=564198 RepID=A0A1W9YZ34_MYCBA|nr:GAF and ANTAR domain-containing protein [Mycolicibacterium bacteremicum]MCV7435100.1 GAF and ANTAR domain-containing protein [Mycolicibacterium bacteremicum]ORA05336.1 response regulator receiver protein [Mycolicibacterium bacteremicum]
MADQLRDLAQQLADLAVKMQDQADTETTLHAVVEGAVNLVPGVRWAGVSLVDGRTVQARVPSDPIVEKLDSLQAELDEGPCLTALRGHRTVRVDDMASDRRWPRYCPAAAAHGAQSMVSLQLSIQRQNLGALNLCGGEPGLFAEDSMFVGGLLAQHAAVALHNAQAEEQFEAALASRDGIGQAKGILMERLGVDADAAFGLLVKLSQDSNVKLVDVARKLVAAP